MMPLEVVLLGIIIVTLSFVGVLLWLKLQVLIKSSAAHQKISEQFLIRLDERDKNLYELRDHLIRLLSESQKEQTEQRKQFDEHQLTTLRTLQDSLHVGMKDIRQQLNEAINNYVEIISKKMDKLTTDTDNKLKEISQQVDKRLADGFEKTTATFTDIIKRLALIDEAQKKITELSLNVVSLQEVLADKRSRGAFGEVQLNHLISNFMPEQTYRLQHTLSNEKRADAILFLPDPTGHIVIDAKFPLESYRRYTDFSLGDLERKQAEQQFRTDIRKHVVDISDKYILPGETSDGAMMFIPAEAIFAEIHSNYPDIIDYAHSLRVWLVSPTTLVAILNTARAVLKDAATRRQIHIIQEHLVQLGKDFYRFQKRIDNLAKHIHQASQDVEEVHKSSKKLTSRFTKIEQVELEQESDMTLLTTED